MHLHTHDPQQPAYHRDIKSANIVLTAAFDPQIIDCGLGKYTTPADADKTAFTRTGAVPGTPLYMCPKYATGHVLFDAKTEIFAFGCVVAEVLTGQLQKAPSATAPSGVNHADSIDAAIADARAGAWPMECVVELRALAGQCLQGKPSQRPSGMVDVLRALRSLEQTYGVCVRALILICICRHFRKNRMCDWLTCDG